LGIAEELPGTPGAPIEGAALEESSVSEKDIGVTETKVAKGLDI
jgi:hypothetical protein